MSVFSDTFDFQGLQRWNLGWPTPNYAGAFLASLICLFWAWRTTRWHRHVILVTEALLCLALAKTFSRGALAASLAGVLFFFLSQRPARIAWRWLAVRIAFLVGAVAFTGFAARLAPGYVATDDSVINRTVLWQNGVRMIAAAWRDGWGGQAVGAAYANWYQPLGDTEGYASLVNSYLQFGASHGVVLLGVAAALGAMHLLVAWHLAAQGDRVAAAAGACLVAWFAANVFSSLAWEPALWVVPAFAAGMILLRTSPVPAARRWTALWGGLAGGVGAGCALYLSGALQSTPIRLKPLPGGAVSARFEGQGTQDRWCIWSDARVLGSRSGKELRRWLADRDRSRLLFVHVPGSTPSCCVQPGVGVMLFGEQVRRFSDVAGSEGTTVWLVHPSVAPPVSQRRHEGAATLVLLLPEIDEYGFNTLWQEWAALNSADVRITRASGISIRRRWLEVAPL